MSTCTNASCIVNYIDSPLARFESEAVENGYGELRLNMAETVCVNVTGCGMVCGGSRGCQAEWKCEENAVNALGPANYSAQYIANCKQKSLVAKRQVEEVEELEEEVTVACLDRISPGISRPSTETKRRCVDGFPAEIPAEDPDEPYRAEAHHTLLLCTQAAAIQFERGGAGLGVILHSSKDEVVRIATQILSNGYRGSLVGTDTKGFSAKQWSSLSYPVDTAIVKQLGTTAVLIAGAVTGIEDHPQSERTLADHAAAIQSLDELLLYLTPNPAVLSQLSPGFDVRALREAIGNVPVPRPMPFERTVLVHANDHSVVIGDSLTVPYELAIDLAIHIHNLLAVPDEFVPILL